MSITYPRILPVGEAAFTVEFGARVAAELVAQVQALDQRLRAAPLPGLIETVPTYRSLLVRYQPTVSAASTMRAWLQAQLELATETQAETGRLVSIPVRYGGEFGPDLEDVAEHCSLSPREVIKRHSAVRYRVAMLGFAPGFAYLLGLDPTLETPRLTTPRTGVPPGSVGIAGLQTGVYALETPGGWQIIGRTSSRLFDPEREEPFSLQAGDWVRFVAE